MHGRHRIDGHYGYGRRHLLDINTAYMGANMTNPAQEAFEKWAEDNDFDASPHDYPLDGVPMYREDITEAAYEAYQASRQDSMAMIAELVGALKFYAPSGHHVHTCRYSDGELVDMYSTVSEDGGKIATAALTKAEAFMKGETV